MTWDITTAAIALALFLVACAGPSNTEPSRTTGTTPFLSTSSTALGPPTPPSSTSVATATTSSETYPISDEWTVDTLITGLDAAAGGLTIDPENNLYTADFGYGAHQGSTVHRVSPDGTITPFSTSELMEQGTGNWFGHDGYLYQSSYGSGHVLRISPAGDVEVLTDQLSGPTGIVVTSDNRIFVDDCNRSQVIEVLPDGTTDLFASHVRFRCPNGLTIDPDGNLYVVHFNNGSLHRITPEGDVEELHRFPTQGAHVQYFEGSLYLTARVSHLVYRYQLDTGYVEIIAGTGQAGFADGRGDEASFGKPNALAIGADGTIYLNHGTGSANNPTTIRILRRNG